jgi:hypothetical protein
MTLGIWIIRVHRLKGQLRFANLRDHPETENRFVHGVDGTQTPLSIGNNGRTWLGNITGWAIIVVGLRRD